MRYSRLQTLAVAALMGSPVFAAPPQAAAKTGVTPPANASSNSQAPTWNPAKQTISFGIAMFPGYEPLDVMGPLQILFRTSMMFPVKLSLIASAAGPITALPPAPELKGASVAAPVMMATHSFANAPKLDILLVPGGWGMMILAQKNDTSIDNFVKQRMPELKYLLSVCTGAASLAKAGVLKGKKATTNKSAWKEITTYGEGITWVPSARWVEDGNIWTSSGVSAGIDMTYAFLSKLYGTKHMNSVMNAMEYAPHTNPNWDPFAATFKVPGASPDSSTPDCPKPLPETPMNM
ncbi:hypothetical protein TWF694_010920 [Orbilia ellipsospora]|uniref:DJ-1/PfpI domain-containing protein n=1 Tax=Orbilia ellipsospora TaxID=2528407 RepID=A0AAV9XAG1_9PEZI